MSVSLSGQPMQLSGGTRSKGTSLIGTDERLPLVTVITAVRNGEQHLAACIESVLAQDYPRVEHIVLDGASTDGTLDILRTFDSSLALWISQPDSGVYDAWNTGVELARGEWIAFLGSDDEYLPGAISAYMDLAAKNPSVEYLSSRLKWVHPTGHTRIRGGLWQWPRYASVMCAAHVGSLHRKRLFAEHGKFDLSYRITADYEFLLRPRGSLRAAFLPRVTVVMRGGGLSDSVTALHEATRAKIRTGGRSHLGAMCELCIGILKFRLRPLRRLFARLQHSSGETASD